MKTKIVSSILAGGMLTAMIGGVAAADQGGLPNSHACHGQLVKVANEAGLTPAEAAELGGFANAGVWNKLVEDALCAPPE